MTQLGVFFDFDDTLIDTRQASSNAYECVLGLLEKDDSNIVAATKIEAVIAKYREYLSSTPNACYKLRTPEQIRTELWEKAIQECAITSDNQTTSVHQIHDLAAKLYHEWDTARFKEMNWLESDTVSTLLELKSRYKLVLITNGSSVIQWKKIKIMKAQEYFDHVLVSGDEPHDKPHASIFAKACKLCDTAPENCVMIGDTVATDIIGANLANLSASILYVGHNCNKDSLQESKSPSPVNSMPDYTISSIKEVSPLLEKIFGCREKSNG